MLTVMEKCRFNRSGESSAKITRLFLLRCVPSPAGAVKSKGGELMKAYELLFIVAPTIDDETRAGVMKRIERRSPTPRAWWTNVDNWGKR